MRCMIEKAVDTMSSEALATMATNHMLRSLQMHPSVLSPGVSNEYIPSDKSDEFYAGMVQGLLIANAWIGDADHEACAVIQEIADDAASRMESPPESSFDFSAARGVECKRLEIDASED